MGRVVGFGELVVGTLGVFARLGWTFWGCFFLFSVDA